LERDGVAWSWLLLASSIEGYHDFGGISKR
jgi:hypothetical protein